MKNLILLFIILALNLTCRRDCDCSETNVCFVDDVDFSHIGLCAFTVDDRNWLLRSSYSFYPNDTSKIIISNEFNVSSQPFGEGGPKFGFFIRNISYKLGTTNLNDFSLIAPNFILYTNSDDGDTGEDEYLKVDSQVNQIIISNIGKNIISGNIKVHLKFESRFGSAKKNTYLPDEFLLDANFESILVN